MHVVRQHALGFYSFRMCLRPSGFMTLFAILALKEAGQMCLLGLGAGSSSNFHITQLVLLSDSSGKLAV